MFYDDAVILFDDPEHSIGEERFLIIGMIKTSKICIVKLSILLDNFFSKIFEIFLNVKLWWQSFELSIANLRQSVSFYAAKAALQ